MELHHQMLPRLAGEALLLGQGAKPYRSGSLPQRDARVKHFRHFRTAQPIAHPCCMLSNGNKKSPYPKR